MRNPQPYSERTYIDSEVIIFRKTKDKFGGLSNMASGFPIKVNGILFPSSEHLYQCLKFTNSPEIQKKIISTPSPMTAKMLTKPHINVVRSDWENIKVSMMRYSIRAKILCNYVEFSKLLIRTYNLPIVEESRRDNFWGTIRKKGDQTSLVGVNALGRLLMELRQEVVDTLFESNLMILSPPAIEGLNILGNPIGIEDNRDTILDEFNHIATRKYTKNYVLNTSLQKESRIEDKKEANQSSEQKNNIGPLFE